MTRMSRQACQVCWPMQCNNRHPLREPDTSICPLCGCDQLTYKAYGLVACTVCDWEEEQ